MKIKSEREKEYTDCKELNSHNDYSSCTMRYWERWANLMEETMENNPGNIPLIAKQTSYDADIEGITAFMYGCSVQILSKFWEYGDILQKWHNGEFIIESEAENV